MLDQEFLIYLLERGILTFSDRITACLDLIFQPVNIIEIKEQELTINNDILHSESVPFSPIISVVYLGRQKKSHRAMEEAFFQVFK